MSGGYSPLTTVDGQGGFHDHPIFGLMSTDTSPVADGVYVAEMQVAVDGMQTSDPFYLVTLVDQIILSDANPEDAAEQLGALIRDYQADPANADVPVFGGKDFSFYVNAVNAVPEPGMASLLPLALLGLMTLRRK